MPRRTSSLQATLRPTGKTRIKEAHVTQQVSDFLKMHGWHLERMHSFTGLAAYQWGAVKDSGRDVQRGTHKNKPGTWQRVFIPDDLSVRRVGKKGWPDWLAIHPTKPKGVMYFELKRPGEKPRPEQIERLNELRIAGFQADWFDCFDNRDDGRKEFWPWYVERWGR